VLPDGGPALCLAVRAEAVRGRGRIEVEGAVISGGSDRAVVVAVAFVRVMQVAIDEVVDVVSVRDSLVTAADTVSMRLVVRAARVRWRACGRVGAGDGDPVFLYAVAIGVMQVPIVQIVGVAFMQDRRVTAICAVSMRMAFVRLVGHGVLLFLQLRLAQSTSSS
jgi:hypothetical protein